MTALRVSVLVACYNRRELTLANLQRLRSALDYAGVKYEIFVLDDASPDGTGDAVSRIFPDVHVLRGDGALFWNRGMQRAYEAASFASSPDAYLLFNDDVAVNADSVAAFISLYDMVNREMPTALAAATVSSDTERVTYSGYRMKARWRPLSLELELPDSAGVAKRVDTFNGNFALIPATILDNIKGLDPYFRHQFGDIDLGLKIWAGGGRVLLAPTPVGYCDDNGSPMPSRHGLAKRLALGLSGREDPRQHIHFILTHATTRPLAWLAICGMLFRRIFVLVANKPHVAPSSPSAKHNTHESARR